MILFSGNAPPRCAETLFLCVCANKIHLQPQVHHDVLAHKPPDCCNYFRAIKFCDASTFNLGFTKDELNLTTLILQ